MRKHKHDDAQAGSQLNKLIAQRVGYKLDQHGDLYDPLGNFIPPYDDRQVHSHSERWGDVPKFSEKLGAAWKLHQYAPNGVTLFDMAWLRMPAKEVALELCKAFLDWTEPSNTD
jgi:hypothetical protein